MVKEGGDSKQDRLTYGFRLCVSRRPMPSELDRVLTFYNQQLSTYQKNAKNALATTGDKQPSDNDPELAAWTMVANVLLNMDETISKE
jgi:hypothetical protein